MTFFEKLLNSESKTITSAAIIIGASSFISRLLGLLRDRILAGSFGAGDELDIYWAAFRIPDLVYNLMVIGALSAGFIPVFTGYLAKKQDKEMWYLTNGVLNLLVASLIVICGILAFFAPWLMKFITPGFSGEKMEMTVSLTRLMFLSPIFLGISAVFGGILQSYKRFFFFSLSPIVYNLGIIFGAMYLVKPFGLYGLAWGVILGAAGHMFIQLPSIVACGYSWRMVFDLTHEGVRKISRLMVPRTLSLATGQISRLGMTAIASTLGAGSLAVFNFADNLRSFPLGIAGLSFAMAAFPTLSEFAAKKNWKEFVKNFSGTARQILFFMIPASLWLIVLRAQLVRLALGTGKFNWEDTIMTIDTLQFFCLGLAASALVYFLIRAFFALEDTKTPFIIGLIVAFVEIVAGFFLSKPLGVAGLGLGISLGGFLWVALLWFFLRGRIGSLDEKKIFLALLKFIGAALLSGLAAWIVLRILDNFVDMRTVVGIFIQGGGAGLAALAVYIAVGILFRCPEAATFWQTLKNRLPWSSVAPEEEVISEQQ